MVARCAARQENTTFAIYQPRVKPICPGCGDPMWWAYSKCSGCVIKEKYDWLNSLNLPPASDARSMETAEGSSLMSLFQGLRS
jgi:hypothetical protein